MISSVRLCFSVHILVTIDSIKSLAKDCRASVVGLFLFFIQKTEIHGAKDLNLLLGQQRDQYYPEMEKDRKGSGQNASEQTQYLFLAALLL
jgi:hypothetical protein